MWETGVQVYGLPTGFVGLAIADLVQPWVTWTPPQYAALKHDDTRETELTGTSTNRFCRDEVRTRWVLLYRTEFIDVRTCAEDRDRSAKTKNKATWPSAAEKTNNLMKQFVDSSMHGSVVSRRSVAFVPFEL
eukprot:SAG31_NODE_2482_length_5634_cov_1.887805_2_plen_132_part_00